MTEVMKVIPISHGIAHQYAVYLSPYGSRDNIHLPQNRKGTESAMQKRAFAPMTFNQRGLVSSPAADFSAVNGKIVNARVADRKPAISENRVAM